MDWFQRDTHDIVRRPHAYFGSVIVIARFILLLSGVLKQLTHAFVKPGSYFCMKAFELKHSFNPPEKHGKAHGKLGRSFCFQASQKQA